MSHDDTDRSLTALYHELNRRLFGGRLPRYRVTFAAQGEAWAQEELEGYQQPQLTWPHLIQEIKDALNELAHAQPRPSVAAIWRVAADILVCRPGEVRRKVPWLPAAWRKACARADQDRALRAQWEQARTRGPG